jgi:hypothetical protein
MEYAMATADFAPYDPETVALLRHILEDAWECLALEQRTQIPKSEIALRILRLAARGERDPLRLRAGAIAELVPDKQKATVEDRGFVGRPRASSVRRGTGTDQGAWRRKAGV